MAIVARAWPAALAAYPGPAGIHFHDVRQAGSTLTADAGATQSHRPGHRRAAGGQRAVGTPGDRPGGRHVVASEYAQALGYQVYAYQMDSHADFEATWQSYNKVIGITGANPGPNCPPAKGGAGVSSRH